MAATRQKQSDEWMATRSPQAGADTGADPDCSPSATPEIKTAWDKKTARRLDKYEAGCTEVHSEQEVEVRVRKADEEARGM